MKNVLILGKGKLAIQMINWFLERPKQYNIICIVPCIPEPDWEDSIIEYAKSKKIPVIESGEISDIPNVLEEDWNIDLVFSILYKKIIKDWFIQKCGRILNIHFAPLPKYRGVRAANWALKNNETEHGVTIHEVTSGIDEGPIVAQLKFFIYPEFDEVIDVYNRSLDYGYVLFKNTMPILDKIVARPQEHDKATYYSDKQNKLLGERFTFTKELSYEQLSKLE